jgi:hypothetical protein
MWRIYGGAVAFLAGASAFIVDYRNRPLEAFRGYDHGTHIALVQGLSNTAYDLIHVGVWALIIAGVLLMIMGLIRYSVASRP